jgi:hypothetical protein
MTKADLITIIADKLKFPWARAELLVDVVFGCMEQSMSRGEKIEIRGFANFTVRQYRAFLPIHHGFGGLGSGPAGGVWAAAGTGRGSSTFPMISSWQKIFGAGSSAP